MLGLVWEKICIFWISLYWCLNFGVVGYNQDLEYVFGFVYENCFKDVG